MAKKLHLIYIPGLGDDRIAGQRKAVSTWRLWGVEAELFQMNWADKEPWEPKFSRLLKRVDYLLSKNNRVGLVGVSAGASAVINLYAARKDQIVGCVLIAGKINRPEAIGYRYHLEDPAFITSASNCQKALANLNSIDRKRILSRYALVDEMVYKADSRITGACNQIVPSIGHVFTIGSQIIFGAHGFINFLKRIPKVG